MGLPPFFGEIAPIWCKLPGTVSVHGGFFPGTVSMHGEFFPGTDSVHGDFFPGTGSVHGGFCPGTVSVHGNFFPGTDSVHGGFPSSQESNVSPPLLPGMPFLANISGSDRNPDSALTVS